ncbi:MAG: hypothetical protein LBJ72_12680 [Dysgonamonadaceae bacterium]|jgi:hypothetical protein|nr:hypothetical protein [Dysgonamonadaceae bacterium]
MINNSVKEVKEKPDYANWIPIKLMFLFCAVSCVLAVLFLLSFLLNGGIAVLLARTILAG